MHSKLRSVQDAVQQQKQTQGATHTSHGAQAPSTSRLMASALLTCSCSKWALDRSLAGQLKLCCPGLPGISAHLQQHEPCQLLLLLLLLRRLACTTRSRCWPWRRSPCSLLSAATGSDHKH